MANTEFYLTEVFLEKTLNYELLNCIEQLKLGYFVTIDINKQSPNTCLVTTKKGDKKEGEEQKGTDKEYVIGEIPEKDSRNLLPYLQMGWSKQLYVGKVSVLNKSTNDHDKRIAIAIYVKKNQ